MNRSTPQIFLSNRLASRRLHRRPVLMASSYLPPAVAHSSPRAPRILTGLPESVVRDAGMLELLAAEMRIAELEKALEEAREAALVDPLTGALNRRGFEQACEREMARVARFGTRFCVVEIDLDDFKRLNDSLGHAVGDRALKHLVSRLQRSLRPSDVVARFGGEEFVVMLPDTGIDAALGVVRRFLQEFSASTIPGTSQRMSFSAGVAMTCGNEDLDDVIQRADQAMYVAKGQGKRCVVAA
ncbi:GGDEF domain-containing protein [uncultured Propionivibrio sp.]|uniref:GGDEF domain-containing protein n=1 Tax=uncultured Propionivibrio sp. TaxID=426737 RepID=UPI0029C0BD0B|nr:GGDEF domain-containing protein [uncultured Propionivibrio sp.]